MTNRIANFVVYEDEDFIRVNRYVKGVKAVCLLNYVMVAFTIRERKTLFSRKKYEISVKLHSLLVDRPYGNKIFDTYEEALDFGKAFVVDRFPAANSIEEIS